MGVRAGHPHLLFALSGGPIPIEDAGGRSLLRIGGSRRGILAQGVSEVERNEERLLDLRLEGDISTEQFHAKRAALQETKEIAKTGLEARRSHRSRLEDFERDKEAPLEYHARLVPEDVDGLTPRIKADSHPMMRLPVYASPDGKLTAEWGCNDAPTPQCSCPSTTQAFRFRALLTDGEREVRFERVAAG